MLVTYRIYGFKIILKSGVAVGVTLKCGQGFVLVTFYSCLCLNKQYTTNGGRVEINRNKFT